MIALRSLTEANHAGVARPFPGLATIAGGLIRV
jgi:hypothetical protein